MVGLVFCSVVCFGLVGCLLFTIVLHTHAGIIAAFDVNNAGECGSFFSAWC